MNACLEIRERLSEYLDGSLDSEEASGIESHLAFCSACREELSYLRAVREALGALKPVDPPSDFLNRLHERMASRSFIKRVARWLFFPMKIKLPFEFITAAAVGVLLFFILNPQQAMKPSLSPHLKDVSEETRKASAPEKINEVREEAQVGAVAPGNVVPDKFDKSESQLEIVLEIKTGSVLSGKASGKEAIKTEQEQAQRTSVTDSTKPMKAAPPFAEEKAAPAPEIKKDAKDDTADKAAHLFQGQESVKARVIGRIVQIGGEVIGSLEEGEEKVLICRIPKDAFGRLRESLESLGDRVSFSQETLQTTADPIEIRVRIVFLE